MVFLRTSVAKDPKNPKYYSSVCHQRKKKRNKLQHTKASGYPKRWFLCIKFIDCEQSLFCLKDLERKKHNQTRSLSGIQQKREPRVAQAIEDEKKDYL